MDSLILLLLLLGIIAIVLGFIGLLKPAILRQKHRGKAWGIGCGFGAVFIIIAVILVPKAEQQTMVVNSAEVTKQVAAVIEVQDLTAAEITALENEWSDQLKDFSNRAVSRFSVYDSYGEKEYRQYAEWRNFHWNKPYFSVLDNMNTTFSKYGLSRQRSEYVKLKNFLNAFVGINIAVGSMQSYLRSGDKLHLRTVRDKISDANKELNP